MRTWRLGADVPVGIAFAMFGAFMLWSAKDLETGTATAMGPGYFPRLMAYLTIALGAGVSVQGLWARSDLPARPSLKALGFVLGGIVVFAVTLERWGLVAATVGLVVLTSLAAARPRWRRVALLAGALTLASVALFVWALKLPFPLWPR